MEPIRYLSLPTTDAAKAVLARYSASIVKQPQVTCEAILTSSDTRFTW